MEDKSTDELDNNHNGIKLKFRKAFNWRLQAPEGIPDKTIKSGRTCRPLEEADGVKVSFTIAQSYYLDTTNKTTFGEMQSKRK